MEEVQCTPGSGAEDLRLVRYRAVGEQNANSYGTDNHGSTTDKAESKFQNKCCRHFLGVFLSILVGVSYVLLAVIVKYLQNYSALELLYYQSWAVMFIVLPFTIFYVQSLPRDKLTLFLIFVMAVMGYAVGVTRFIAFQILPLGDASVIVFSTPHITAIFARFILKEHISRLFLLSLLISLIGLCLTAKLPVIISAGDIMDKMSDRNHLYGCGMAFLSVIFASFSNILARKLKYIHPIANVFIQSTIGVILLSCAFPLLDLHLPKCDASPWILQVLGAIGLICVLIYLRAMQFEDATVVATMISCADIVLSFLSQLFIFTGGIDVYSISGAVLVFTSGLMMPAQRYLELRPEGHRFKMDCFLK